MGTPRSDVIYDSSGVVKILWRFCEYFWGVRCELDGGKRVSASGSTFTWPFVAAESSVFYQSVSNSVWTLLLVSWSCVFFLCCCTLSVL